MPVIIIPIFFVLLYLFGKEATLNTALIQLIFFILSFALGCAIGVFQKRNCYKFSLVGIVIVAAVYAAIYAPTHSLWIVGMAFLSIPFLCIFLGIFTARFIARKFSKANGEDHS